MMGKWREWQGGMTRVDEEQCGWEHDCGRCQRVLVDKRVEMYFPCVTRGVGGWQGHWEVEC
jgi:hypothetical protein